MGMTIAARVAHRFRHADTFIRLDPISVPIPNGGEITAADLERALHASGIEAHDLTFTRRDGDAPTTIRWEGTGGNDGELVAGRLLVRVNHDRERVSVTAEIALAATYSAAVAKSR
jgi:hypothetical protein